MRRFILVLTIIATIACNKNDKENGSYPDCFKDTPSNTYSVNSCGNLTSLIYIDNNKAVSIELNDSALALKTTCTTYNISDHPTDIHIKYYTYANHPDSMYFNYCTDVFVRKYGLKTTWTAVSGSVTTAVSKLNRTRCEDYTTSIRLDNVKFINGSLDTTISLHIKDKIVNACIP